MKNHDWPLKNITNKLLHLIIMPTEQCNFRCTYCYEDFALGRMSPGIVTGLKLLIERRAPTLDLLAIAWFGGEPTLALDIVADVQSHAQALARQSPGLRVGASMTTNGYLLDRHRFQELLNLGVREFQISLDGPGEFHDRRRVKIGGQGTFDRIWENLRSATS